MVRRAFTLLELILVMLVLAATAAFVAPSMAGSRAHRDLHQGARDVLALTRLARARAAGEGRDYRLRIDEGSLRLVRSRDPLNPPDDPEDPEREAPKDDETWGRTVTLPEGVTLLEAEVAGLIVAPPFEIAFHPGGGADAALLLWANGSEQLVIEVDPLLGQAKVVEDLLQ